MGLRLRNSSGNYVELNAPSSIATDVNLTLPNTDGDSGQYLQTNGSGALSWATVTDTTGWTWDTTGTSLTGSSVTVTGIPSNAKVIQVMMQGMSHDATEDTIFRVGTSSGAVTSGYNVGAGYLGSSSNNTTRRTNGFQGYAIGTASKIWNLRFTLTKINGNVWWGESFIVAEDAGDLHWMAGEIDAGGTVDRVVFTMVSGNYDAGTAYVSYFAP